MRYEYQEVVAAEGEAFWAECNRLGAEGWRLMDREDFERRDGSLRTAGAFERVTADASVADPQLAALEAAMDAEIARKSRRAHRARREARPQ